VYTGQYITDSKNHRSAKFNFLIKALSINTFTLGPQSTYSAHPHDSGLNRSRPLTKLRDLPLTYREYDMGHEIRPRSLTDLSAWLDEKVLSPILLAA
jgi:hypothetical protein